jgi:cytochrome c peroxidase
MAPSFRKTAAIAILTLAPVAASPQQGEPARSALCAAIRFVPSNGDLSANRERMAGLIETATRRGARLVVLPELASTGPLDAALAARAIETIPGPTTSFFGALARRLGISIAVPLLERAGDSGYFLSTVLLDDRGAVQHVYRKITPRFDGADGPGMRRGDPRTIIDSLVSGNRRIAVIAGDDIQAGVPRLAIRGASVILISANWSLRDPLDWSALCRQLSAEYRVMLVVASSGASPGGIFMNGQAVGSAEDEIFLAALPPARIAPPVPLGLPPVPTPTFYTADADLVELGRALFFDPHLSSNAKVSCATCHDPKHAFANAAAFGIGVSGQHTIRSVPSLLNVAFRAMFFWDGHAASLENQVKYPISHRAEMNYYYFDLVAHLRSRPEYAGRVPAGEEAGFETISRALASYERTLLSANSPFDRHQYGGDPSALTPPAVRGQALFTGKAHCSQCHLIGESDATFMDQQAHNTGVSFDRRKKTFRDIGVGNVADSRMNGQFVTPSLRNVALTAPYMHDGSIRTLSAVVDYYDRGGNANPTLDPKIVPLHLTAREKHDLVAFLQSLTGDQPLPRAKTRVANVRP